MQKQAWVEQITILRSTLVNRDGNIYFEFGIPRMGKRIDVVLIIGPVIFVLEFKVGDTRFTSLAIDQVCNYCLDLKNFHNESHKAFIAPIVIATGVQRLNKLDIRRVPQNGKLFEPIKSTVGTLKRVIDAVLANTRGESDLDCEA